MADYLEDQRKELRRAWGAGSKGGRSRSTESSSSTSTTDAKVDKDAPKADEDVTMAQASPAGLEDRITAAVTPEGLTAKIEALELNIEERDKTIKYLEELSESLRRKLEKYGEDTSNTWSIRAATMTDEQLRLSVAAKEIHDTFYATTSEDEEQSFAPRDMEKELSKRRKAGLARGTWVHRTSREPSYDARDKSKSPAPEATAKGKEVRRTLDERIERPQKPLPTKPLVGDGAPSLPLTVPIPEGSTKETTEVNDPAGTHRKVSVEWVANHCVAERDADGHIVVIDRKHPGLFSIFYGVLIDLSLDFPPVAPTTFDRNPLTTFRWTAAELEIYPRGLPGYPSTCYPPEPLPNGAMPEVRLPVNEPVLKVMDRSKLGLQALAIPRHQGRKPWRHPVNDQEVFLVKNVAQQPCNSLAFEFWGEIVQRANNVPSALRSPVQWTISRSIAPRPMWAPFRAPKSRSSKTKARSRRHAKSAETPAVSETTEQVADVAQPGGNDEAGSSGTTVGDTTMAPTDDTPITGDPFESEGMGPNDTMHIG